MDASEEQEREQKSARIPWLARKESEAAEQAERSSPRWRSPTRQQQGIATEKKLLKERGAKVHPRSGAGSIKEDGSDDEFLYEVKDAMKQFSLRGDSLRTSFVRATRQGKEAVWLVYFTEAGLTAEIKIVNGRKMV